MGIEQACKVRGVNTLDITRVQEQQGFCTEEITNSLMGKQSSVWLKMEARHTVMSSEEHIRFGANKKKYELKTRR